MKFKQQRCITGIDCGTPPPPQANLRQGTKQTVNYNSNTFQYHIWESNKTAYLEILVKFRFISKKADVRCVHIITAEKS